MVRHWERGLEEERAPENIPQEAGQTPHQHLPPNSANSVGGPGQAALCVWPGERLPRELPELLGRPVRFC